MNATETAVEPAAVKKRFAGFGNNGEGALNRLREMVKRETEIAQKYKSVLDECKKVEAEVATATAEFESNPTPDGVHKLITIRLRSREATEIFAALDQRLRYGVVGREFFAEFKNELRGVMVAANKYKLTEAQQAFALELKRARETLSKEGFDQEEIMQAPKVRSAQRLVERFTRLVEDIRGAKDESLWSHAGQLLEK
jgi:hypothetical protein